MTKSLETDVDHRVRQPSSKPAGDDVCRMVAAAVAATPAPNTHTLSLVTSGDSGIRVLELTSERAGNATIQIEGGVATIALKKTSHVFPTDLSNKPIHVLKGMTVANVVNSLAPAIATEATILKTIRGRVCAGL